jgi:A/G-specific adenine glycosylase
MQNQKNNFLFTFFRLLIRRKHNLGLKMMWFSEKITDWYRKNARSLPWRETKDPYKIWLSEVILQQTRVEQGLPYYNVFLKEFPSVNHLSRASETKVLKLWQGLGYYSRARNLHFTAKTIVSEYGPKGFPSSYNELIQLKGIGNYTASAISSFAFGEVRAVVDGNVYRVLSRVFGIKEPIDTTKGKNVFLELAGELISKKNPGEYNQAVMEFGALVCVPKKPGCGTCIFNGACSAIKNKTTDKLPVKSKKTLKRKRLLYYFDVIVGNKRLIKKRDEPKDIWFGLYDFPLFESKLFIKDNDLIIEKFTKEIAKESTKNISVGSIKYFKHILTHQELHAYFTTIKLKEVPVVLKKNFILVPIKKHLNYPIPKLFEKYLNSQS